MWKWFISGVLAIGILLVSVFSILSPIASATTVHAVVPGITHVTGANCTTLQSHPVDIPTGQMRQVISQIDSSYDFFVLNVAEASYSSSNVILSGKLSSHELPSITLEPGEQANLTFPEDSNITLSAYASYTAWNGYDTLNRLALLGCYNR